MASARRRTASCEGDSGGADLRGPVLRRALNLARLIAHAYNQSEGTTAVATLQTTGRISRERRDMLSEEKTVRELRDEHGLTVEELAEGMRISERDLMLLEASGQKYYALDVEWFALLAGSVHGSV